MLDLNVVAEVSVAGGSGYTDSTNYAWTSTGGRCGTNATGTMDVINGILQNVKITSRGTSCKSEQPFRFRRLPVKGMVERSGLSYHSCDRRGRSLGLIIMLEFHLQ